ncbi:hypothetical protein AAY473_014755 [Plecturocebus cupreus]
MPRGPHAEGQAAMAASRGQSAEQGPCDLSGGRWVSAKASAAELGGNGVSEAAGTGGSASGPTGSQGAPDTGDGHSGTTWGRAAPHAAPRLLKRSRNPDGTVPSACPRPRRPPGNAERVTLPGPRGCRNVRESGAARPPGPAPPAGTRPVAPAHPAPSLGGRRARTPPTPPLKSPVATSPEQNSKRAVLADFRGPPGRRGSWNPRTPPWDADRGEAGQNRSRPDPPGKPRQVGAPGLGPGSPVGGPRPWFAGEGRERGPPASHLRVGLGLET